MADAKHTPGPWLWQHSGDGDGRYVVWTRQPHTGELATVHCEDINGDYPAKANAQLIAAAPELLSHLRFAVKLLKPWAGGTAQVEAMEAAIAKAEGRS